MNILFLSAGRRVELLQWFKRARNELGIKGNIVAVDISKFAPAIYYADIYVMVPRVDANEFISEIIKVCNEYDIDLVIPTIDTELPILVENKEQLESLTNAKIMISNKKVIDIGKDKFVTYNFLKKNCFGVPNVIDENSLEKGEYKFPLFIKPLDGSSSINAFKVNNEKELSFFREYVPNPIIQEFAEGDEYTIDVFCDFEGNPITIVPRKRVATRGGEVSKAVVIREREIIDEVKRMVNVLKPIGPITVQCIKGMSGIKFIEINPRFGGGAPISMKAGANSAKNIYKLLMGEKLSYYEDYEDGLVALRYDQAVFLDMNGNVIK
ncbi:ATP-grasp domain-containing protein [Crassaminicella indica]|uniref:ATP-grasp domain-containing protein n=1 Tax=Crassaminicella indica TaxID=2855394 RepID=A0ABX8RC96_9CLOT|nr:ATP-grasp domain-containing protein [Crassaminicella indica]QXM06672.1 ATP-grasp domain-containing protein [Crassaminicella indica]